ncbi:MAG: bifunctional (p)ppGpp synthetase/guanosine-3',5'-bis(diphosphate) 3'-pyrophosphohydrolase [Candidatus Pacebacteria bacterium]|nr:bifunctional (p)ppGpp synthetase/guanosine-3',5'-bis(diphosphate) 3'-pyrophosphohydrolase [Candidatus Paceibacterota bacterium]
MTTVKEIIGAMQTVTPEDRALIEKAYDFAKKAHEGHFRYSGEPYFIHPSAVAKHLAELGLDAPTVAAALMHDAIEDAKATSEEVEREFGSEVLFLVEGVTKLGKHKYQGGERHAESLRRLLVATAADVRVLIVKLADRYHNMTTLEHVPPEKRKRIALETLEIYAPLADRLGMGRIRKDFEDMAFPFIDPDAYTHAVEIRKLAAKETEAGLTKVQKEVRHALARKGIKDFTTGIRMKGLWSLHQKLKRKGDDITRIHDIAALRIIVPTVEDAYTALGMLHAMWKPLPGEFKDYIAVPKPSSGYQSLHTTVVTPEAGIVEIQIRTNEMHEQAEFGIASHGSYKAVGRGAKQGAVQRLSLPWIRDLIPNLLQLRKPGAGAASPTSKVAQKNVSDAPRWLSDLADAHAKVAESSEFVEGLKSDFFSHRIFVFTPRGDVIDLPTGSTPVDFAYAIHSDLGEHMQGAKINSKLVSFDTELKNGDIIEILKSKNARPTAKWHDYARTSMARRHIRSYLDTHERPQTTLQEIKPLRIKKKKNPKKSRE